MASPRIAAEYIGTGTEHLGGIPASDLTEEQIDALPEDRRTELLANAAGDHAIYKLHGRDIKSEAKEIAAGDAPAASEAQPVAGATAPKATTRPAGADKPPADTKGGE